MSESLTFRTVVKFMIFSIGAILILLYLIFQARFLIIGPRVILIEELDVPQNERQIFLTGNAYNISRLWLNDRQIYTNAQGNFKEALVLENGYTIATLRAEDRYGRETMITRSFVYAPVSFIR
jgi:hypothetical protein